MIDHIDNLLRRLFISGIDEIEEEQVGFQPPDEKWRTYVTGQSGNVLNVYLADVRENRKLRSNELTRVVQNGTVSETPAPVRIDCHYIITAWSPADTAPAIEPILDEHALLYQTIGVLMNRETLNPKEIYGEGNLPGTFPQAIADADLPVAVLPVEGFGKLPEFWGTVEWRWKPMAYIVITLPVLLDTKLEAPMVTTRITEYHQRGKPETTMQLIHIAGKVYETDDPTKLIAGAEVLLDEKEQSVLTGADGRFSFSALLAGNYTLKVSKEGFADKTKSIEVPGKSAAAFDVGL